MIEIGEKVGGKAERKEGNEWRSSYTGAETEHAMTISVAKEANISSAGDNRACSDGRS